MGRAIVAVVAGIVAAFVVILACESIGHFIVPVGSAPVGDSERMREFMSTLPITAYAFGLAAYLAGSHVGGFATGFVARSFRVRGVWVVGALVLASAIANLFLILHPLWFSTATVAFIVLGTWLASVTVSRRV